MAIVQASLDFSSSEAKSSEVEVSREVDLSPQKVSVQVRWCLFSSSYSLRRPMMGADTNIQFSEPQLEQIKWAEEETTKARLVSQSAHKTIRFSSSLVRLMSLRLIFEPQSNL